MNKEEIKKSYYYTDIEPKYNSLDEIIAICIRFLHEGGDRLINAIEMRGWDVYDIEQLTLYIMESRHKMEKELFWLKKYEAGFIEDFATNHNDYYNSVAVILQHIRSHTAPFKKLLKKTCSTRHPNKAKCQQYNISPKSVMTESVLASGTYQRSLFDINDPIYPSQVSGLNSELKKFFAAEEGCMRICKKMLDDEEKVRKDPNKSVYSLNVYRRKAAERLRNQILLITDDAIEMLKGICPAYKCFGNYSNETAFAQEEFHKHNVADMDHFCLIEMATAMQKDQLSSDELANWGNNPLLVMKIRSVILHFDELLPDYFTHKMMGRFQYYFCKWALPDKIKRATTYFIANYQGKWKVSKYAAVNAHGQEYYKNNEEVAQFNRAIAELLKREGLFDSQTA